MGTTSTPVLDDGYIFCSMVLKGVAEYAKTDDLNSRREELSEMMNTPKGRKSALKPAVGLLYKGEYYDQAREGCQGCERKFWQVFTGVGLRSQCQQLQKRPGALSPDATILKK